MAIGEPLQEATHQSGFAGAGFASQNVEAPARLHAEHQFGDGGLISLAGEQEARIGRNMERVLLQTEGAKERIVAFRSAGSGHRTPEDTAWGL